MKNATSYLDYSDDIQRHKNHLPHWQQEGTWQFVTWHLGDAVPVSKRQQMTFERKQWLLRNPKPWDPPTQKEYMERFEGRFQKWLDQGIGKCWLQKPACSGIVSEHFQKWSAEKIDVDCYVIMPNHVHALFRPFEGEVLENIMKNLKGATAFYINKELGRKGTFWMEDYWDRMIRSEAHFLRVRKYIVNNPEKAKLSEGQFVLKKP